MLSAQAAPFAPLSFEPVELVIFNNGVPSMVVANGHDVVRNIPDEAIDEAFPPSAVEADEIEDVEHYVNLMARLAMMEEREQATREDHVGMLKRWQVRRELVGRPRQARHLVTHVEHGKRRSLHEDLTKDLVIFDHSHIELENRLRARRHSKAGVHNAKNVSKRQPFYNKKALRPIQQPRK